MWKISQLTLFLALLLLGNDGFGQINAAFSSNVISGCAPLSVSFTNQSTGSITAWNWSFGNGNSSTLQNPGAVYANPGIYTVTLTVSNAVTSDTEIKTAFITVFANPVADFSVTDSSGCLPFNPGFTDQSTPGSGAINSWFWSFGDGFSSNSATPNFTYSSQGNYTVVFKVTDINGCQSVISKPNLIQTFGPRAQFATNQFFCDTPYLANFSNQSTGTSLTYSWDFGNMSTSVLPNPTTTYNLLDTFLTTLVVTDISGCTDTLTKEIIGGDLTPQFNMQISCNPNTINSQFTNLTTPQGTSWLWDFGDNHFSATQNPSHTYSLLPDTVFFTVTQGNCQRTGYKVYLPVNSTFNAGWLSCDDPMTYTFSPTSVGGSGSYSYNWNFGNDSTSNLANPSITYTNSGDSLPTPYVITLTTTDNAGCSSINSDTLLVYDSFTSYFTFDKVEGCIPLDINFTNLSSGGEIISWDWFVNDSLVANTENLYYTFTDTGYYDIKLVNHNILGCSDTIEIKNLIRAGTYVDSVNFTFQDSVCYNNLVQFTDLSFFLDSFNYMPTDWCWTFSWTSVDTVLGPCGGIDPFGAQSGNQHPTHQYNDNENTYTTDSINGNAYCNAQQLAKTGWDTVQLAVAHYGCYSAFQKPIYLIPSSASFGLLSQEGSCDLLSSCGDSIYFGIYNNSLNADTMLFLHMIHENTGDTLLKFITDSDTLFYNYSLPGTYRIEMAIANNASCSDTIIRSFYIDSVSHGFDMSNDTICVNNPVALLDTTYSLTGSRSSLIWHFGDGDSLVGQFPLTQLIKQEDSHNGRTGGTYLNPTHLYADSGSYLIRLTTVMAVENYVFDSQESTPKYCEYESQIPIFVHRIIPNFLTDTLEGCEGLSVTFTQNSSMSGNLTTSIWDFGDGSPPDTAITLTHIFDSSGNFSVTLYVLNNFGCDAEIIKDELIYITQPRPDFTASNAVCEGQIINFTNLSEGEQLSYNWYLGDGDSSVLVNPVHTYSTFGYYNVCLMATDFHGCVTTITKDSIAQIYELPVASFTQDTAGANCPPLPVNFVDTSSTIANTWFWDFGDGQTSVISAPLHTYTTSGAFEVTLAVINTNGCTDTIVKPAFINIGGPTGTGYFVEDSGCVPHLSYFYANTENAQIYTWDFGDGNISNAFSDSLTHTYMDGGIFEPVLILSDTTNCMFTVNLGGWQYVDVNEPNFEFGDSILCMLGTVSFINQSENFFNYSNFWDLAEGDTSTLEHPIKIFSQQGNYMITLTVTSNFCSKSISKSLTVFQKPEILFSVSDTIGCIPLDISLEAINLTPQLEINSWIWESTVNGTTLSSIDTVLISTSGNYQIESKIIYGDSSCFIDSSFNIEAYDWTISQFDYSPNEPWIGNAEILFDNQSSNADIWYWNFGDGNMSVNPFPIHTYLTAGTFQITLITSNNAACNDTTYKTIFVPPASLLEIPNVFTPDGNGKNDFFDFYSEGIKIVYATIYNRWGTEVYRWSNTEGGWNGNYPDGTPASEGIYYYIIGTEGYDGITLEQTGFLYLMRK